MNIIDPLSVAWQAVSKQLFQNFRFGKWFALGLSAWLANILIGNTGNCTFPFNILNVLLDVGSKSHSSSGLIPQWPQFLASAPVPGQATTPDLSQAIGGSSAFLGIFGVILIAVVVVALALGLVMLWLGCRGQFMLLDNVLHDRDQVIKPWKEFRKHGNSLFLPFLFLGGGNIILIFAVVIGVVAFSEVPGLGNSVETWVWVVLGLVCMLSVALVVLAAILLMLVREVGSVWMYRNGGTAWDAMRRILALAAEKPADVVLYIVARIVLGIVFWSALMLVGFATCCLGFLPYLNTVITLPVSVFRVVYNVELVAQFGAEFDVRIPGTPAIPGLPPDAAV
ncbi:hypothetical protein TSACC_21950 [Terrimicrobium sacchariphilum]|jgi:hypothetical protein|uniref:Uncharacterized protein n=1 Tax=Terrimicrobium sacchariphilum TaxID=690879 RepID=A0A146G886_TERSA|nr:hypothetical protein [Terrimicrobium sacchariphilum]GAT33533.1 hypothetical protein TSACC_21950 [Terrimicrobium sacchariphilum]